jgi:uncharacterized protein
MIAPASGEVTLVSGALVLTDRVEAYAQAHYSAVEAAERLGGLVGADLVPAIPGVQDDTVSLMTFASRADLDRWLASPERDAALQAMTALTHGERRLNVISGFPGWFPDGSSVTPARWRQAVVVLAGLIPVALVGALARQSLLPTLPLLLSVVATSTFNVAALTWIVMPRLNGWFRTWLYHVP